MLWYFSFKFVWIFKCVVLDSLWCYTFIVYTFQSSLWVCLMNIRESLLFNLSFSQVLYLQKCVRHIWPLPGHCCWDSGTSCLWSVYFYTYIYIHKRNFSFYSFLCFSSTLNTSLSSSCSKQLTLCEPWNCLSSPMYYVEKMPICVPSEWNLSVLTPQH